MRQGQRTTGRNHSFKTSTIYISSPSTINPDLPSHLSILQHVKQTPHLRDRPSQPSTFPSFSHIFQLWSLNFLPGHNPMHLQSLTQSAQLNACRVSVSLPSTRSAHFM